MQCRPALHYSVDLRIQTCTEPVPLNYGKLATEYPYVDIRIFFTPYDRQTERPPAIEWCSEQGGTVEEAAADSATWWVETSSTLDLQTSTTTASTTYNSVVTHFLNSSSRQPQRSHPYLSLPSLHASSFNGRLVCMKWLSRNTPASNYRNTSKGRWNNKSPFSSVLIQQQLCKKITIIGLCALKL